MRRLPLGSYPSLPSFVHDLITGSGPARNFLSRPHSAAPRPLASTPFRDEITEGLRRTNEGWGNDVVRELETWRTGNVVTLVAGQQVGFGGGPLYTLAKIASLIHLRQQLRASGRDAVAFFWMAGEDHDFLEAATITVPTQGDVRTLRAVERPAAGRIVGTLPLPESLITQLERHDPSLGGEWSRRGITFLDSFATLLASVLRGHGVVLVDSMLPELRRGGRELFEQIATRWSELQDAVRGRSRRLEEAGYHPQVEVSEAEHPLLWIVDEGIRNPVRSDGDGFRIGEKAVRQQQLLDRIVEQPERVSTGALARPLVQDLLFGTDFFIGGPAEVSYYAQSEELHEALGIRAPAVLLRSHTLVTREKILTRLQRHQLELHEVFESPDEVLARREQHAVDQWNASVEKASEELRRQIAEAAPMASSAAPEMERSITRSMRRIEYHLRRMRERGARGIARRNRERAETLEQARISLAPGGVPQDRIVAWLPLMKRFGEGLVPALIECGEPHTDSVTVVGFDV